jgi:putative salt-induced outer membrane protein YdiY
VRRVPAALLLSLAGLAGSAAADVVRMKSGDVVSGKIEKVSDEELTIDPPFSDAFDVKLKYIASIVTDRPVKVTFKDGRELNGYVELAPDGSMHVRAVPTRWDQQHADDRPVLEALQPQLLPPGTVTPLGALVEVKELEVAYYRYEADVGVGFNAASGNSESSSLALSASLDPEWGPNALHLQGSWNRQESNQVLSADNWNVVLQYQRDLPREWFAFGLTSQESDPFQNLVLRSIYGAGAGYRFYDVDPTHLSVSLGAGYIQENYSGPSADRDLPAALWTLNFERDFFDSDLTIYHRQTIAKALTKSELLVQTVQGVKLDLFGDFDLRLEFDWDYNSDPALGVSRRHDFRYLVNLDYAFEGDETDWLH